MSRNDALRAARLRVGWRSAETAAAQLTERGRQFLDDRHFNVSPRTWRRWEGARPGWPSEETALVLHDALGRWPEQLGFTPPAGWVRPGHQEQTVVPDAGFLSVTAPALAPGPLSPQQVDPALIDYFQAQLEGHYRADMLLGPHDLIGTLGPQYRLIDKLTRSAAGETRRGLLRVGAAYAALVGWLYQDAGDLAAAEVGPHLRRVHHGVADEVRIMALQQQAHGASLLHHAGRAEVDRLIDTAGRLLPRVDDDLPWGNACRRTPGYLEVQRATCYGRLGLGEEASGLWEQVLAVVPASARGDRGVYLARHATAAATARRPEQAVEIAREVAVVAVETGSARMRSELSALERVMRPWHDAPVGRDLREALAPVREGS
ncbi:Twin-arginine translocation pathway signal [Streptomyces filamentosus]|uniref:Twin-arginine translocation pathway signal n=1 Tax=Streptomyces filamentosus TaxID=67294 RepID=UPI0036E4A5A0